MQELETESSWQEYVALMTERPELFREEGWLTIEKDPEVIRRYEQKSGKRIGVVYKSEYHMMVVDLIKGENGTHFCYERLLPMVEKGAIVSVPVFDGKFVLLRQYRHAIREFQYGFPRGFGEAGVSVEENVRKEIREELNAEVTNMQHLGQVVADSGVGSNKVDIYFCSVAEPMLKLGYEEIEKIQLLTKDELDTWIAEEKITDGFTLAGYSMYQAKRKNI